MISPPLALHADASIGLCVHVAKLLKQGVQCIHSSIPAQQVWPVEGAVKLNTLTASKGLICMYNSLSILL